MTPLSYQIEALFFASPQPINIQDIQECMSALTGTFFSVDYIETSLQELMEFYQNAPNALEIVPISGGYTMMTKPEYHGIVGTFLKLNTKKRLSQAAIETLSIVAYKQPVSKIEMESIRGVNCDYAIQKLLEKELIVISGRSEAPGRPLLYSTSEKFMDYFGIKQISDLPKLKDFAHPESEVGETNMEEAVVN